MHENYNHHYVPQSILRNFEHKENTVYSLLQVDGLPIKPINVKNLCQERNFYTVLMEKSDDPKIVERINYDIELFQEMDREIAPILKKIIKNEDIKSINLEERDKLIMYTVYQNYRTRAAKNIAAQFWNDKNLIDQAHAGFLKDYNTMISVANILHNYQLDIINPILEDEFVISDSPVLWVATGEGIYFPISPNICLYYHNKKYDLENCLDSICINDLQFRASVKHTISQSESILKKIKNNEYKDHIVKFFKSGKPSYWKCILETNSSDKCISKFINEMDDFKNLI
jgi:hypothetical protein